MSRVISPSVFAILAIFQFVILGFSYQDSSSYARVSFSQYAGITDAGKYDSRALSGHSIFKQAETAVETPSQTSASEAQADAQVRESGQEVTETGASGSAPETSQIAVEELEELLALLEDEEARTAFVENLQNMREILANETQEDVNDFGAETLGWLNEQMSRLRARLQSVTRHLADLPRLTKNLWSELTQTEFLADHMLVVIKMLIVLTVATVAMALVNLLLRRPKNWLRHIFDLDPWQKIPVSLVIAALEVVGVSVFLIASQMMIGVLLYTHPDATVITAGLVGFFVMYSVALIAWRTPLRPDAEKLRWFPLSDEAAHYHMIWGRRIFLIGILGYYTVEVLATLSHSANVGQALWYCISFFLIILTMVYVLQNRRDFRRYLQGLIARHISVHTSKSTAIIARFLRHLADFWHLIALFYLSAAYLIWLSATPGGVELLIEGTIGMTFVVVAAYVLNRIIQNLLQRLFAVSPELSARFPGLEKRANRYVSFIESLLRVIIILVAVVGILLAWGGDIEFWLRSEWIHAVFGGILSIALTIVLAVIAWEMINAAIENWLGKLDTIENSAHQARMRTVLPLLRNAFLIFLLVVAGLIILAELGMNIGPLLAGAGVIGLAVGFGSQALVKDVINGLFIMFENTISVGDVVQVAGYAGLVEGLSVRSIRLRDLSGNVHVIPFGDVSAVTNMTKDFSYYLLNVGIAYREDVDRVIATLQELGAELQKDEIFGVEMLAPLEVLGVDSFGDNAVVIKARLMTKPIKQWMVGREFNRRMKKRFDELGIEIPFPHRTIYFGVDQKGAAPPAHIFLEGGRAEGLAFDESGQAGPSGTKRKRVEKDPKSQNFQTPESLVDPDGED